MSIVDQAKHILEQFPIYKELPASLSGKHHFGETHKTHIELTVIVMEHLCDEFNIKGEDRDLLIAAAYLHDIGLYKITQKGKVDLPGWKYFEQSGYSRNENLMYKHGTVGAQVLDDFEIDRKEELKRLISVHMSHWYKDEPQPNTLYEYLICIADYIASKGENIFRYEKTHK